MSAEPTEQVDCADVLAAVTQGKSIKVFPGATKLTVRFRGSVGGLIVKAERGDKVADFGLALFRIHEGVSDFGEGILLTVGSSTDTHLLKQYFSSSASKEQLVSAVLRALRTVASKLLSGPQAAAASTKAESTLLYRNADFMLVASTDSAGCHSWELVPFTGAGRAVVESFGRRGICVGSDNGKHFYVNNEVCTCTGGSADYGVIRSRLLRAVKQQATAAAEPREAPKTWDDFVAVYRKHAESVHNHVILTHGNISVAWDKEEAADPDHDKGLVPVMVTIGGKKVTAYDPKEDMDWPVPYIRFSFGYEDTMRFDVAISDLATKSGRELHKTLSVPRPKTAEQFITAVHVAIKKVLEPMLPQIKEPDEIATAAAQDFLPAVLRAVGYGASKLIGFEVNDMLVVSAAVLSETPDVSLRLTGAGATTFLVVRADKTATATCYRGASVRTETTRLTSSRLPAIKNALAVDVKMGPPAEVTAAAEPQSTYSVPVLTKLAGMKISGKHFKIVMRSPHPTTDDRGQVYILGDVELSKSAEAVFGERTYQNGFTIMALPSGLVALRMPQIYPKPEAPLTIAKNVPLLEDVNSAVDVRSAVQHCVQGIVNVFKPWFDALSAVVDNDVVVRELVDTTWPEVSGEDYKLEGLVSTRRNHAMQRLELEFRFEMTKSGLDRYLAENLNTRFSTQSLLKLYIGDSQAPGKVPLYAEAYAPYTGSIRRPLEAWRERAVETSELKKVVVSFLREYIFTMETALYRAN